MPCIEHFDLGEGWMGRRMFSAFRRVLAAALIFAAPLVSTGVASAAGPFEPNNTLAEAAGPLLLSGTYDAATEGSSDKDFYYFYVTSAPSARIELTIKNLGGLNAPPLNASIVDGLGTVIDGFAYLVQPGAEATSSIDLAPQKYFLEVEPTYSANSTATTYSLVAGGNGGAFGPFAQIEAKCASARTQATAAKRKLRRAQARLQRATARLRRSALGTAAAHRDASSNYQHAKAQTKKKRNALRATAKTQDPWCGISP
jgi:hypothetical protein